MTKDILLNSHRIVNTIKRKELFCMQVYSDLDADGPICCDGTTYLSKWNVHVAPVNCTVSYSTKEVLSTLTDTKIYLKLFSVQVQI